jgi:hypothetical protein
MGPCVSLQYVAREVALIKMVQYANVFCRRHALSNCFISYSLQCEDSSQFKLYVLLFLALYQTGVSNISIYSCTATYIMLQHNTCSMNIIKQKWEGLPLLSIGEIAYIIAAVKTFVSFSTQNRGLEVATCKDCTRLQ